MRRYDANDFQWNGTIDIEANTYIPQLKDKAGNLTNGWFEFDKSETIFFQLTSSDLSADVTWALQISADKTNWATAKDSSGTDVTGTMASASPIVVEPFRGVGNMYFRIALTVTTQTGNVAYIIRNGDV